SRAGALPGMSAAAMSSITLRKISVTAASELLPFVIGRIRRRLKAARAQARRRGAAGQTRRRCIAQNRALPRGRQAAQLIALKAEAGDQFDQATGLVLKAFRRGSSFLDQSRILLGDLIHLCDGTRDLVNAARLLAAGAAD